MVTYIYFVKCPNCEDEHFDFFDEAKAFAMGCMSQKPIITQTEVTRNDFGECTDHCDLGTVWSWEDVVGKESEVEPITFAKDDIKADYDSDNDPEFQNDEDFRLVNEELIESRRISFNNKEDQQEFFRLCRETGMITDSDLDRFMQDHNATDVDLLDKLRAYKAELDSVDMEESCERKPIPEGMTIEQLKEAMEENEDTVECAGCEELFPKDECFHKEGIGWLCGNCEDRIVKCTWCDELYDKGECRYEVGFDDWLCSRCEMAIKSRGETLTFREGNYWDFLDEELKPKTWICEFDGHEIGTVEASKEEEAYEAMEREYPEYHYGLYDGVGIVYPADEEDLTEATELHDLGNEYDGGYPAETPEVSDSHLKLCPECGKETFDSETGICVNCGTSYLAEALTDNDINDILQAVKLANKTIEDKIDDAATDIKKLVVQHHELVGKGLDQEFKKTSDKLDQILQK